MIISLSAANYFYWLARYVVRLKTIVELQPWDNSDKSHAYSDAFGIEANDPILLKKLLLQTYEPASFKAALKNMHENIQSVRGIISQDMFEAFNNLWRHQDDFDFIAANLEGAIQSLQQLPADVGLFFRLGFLLESLDVALRLERSTEAIIEQLNLLAALLPSCWNHLNQYIEALTKMPNWGNFYQLTFNLHDGLERGV